MGAERLHTVLLALLTLTTGCVSRSIESDLGAVRRLSEQFVLAEVGRYAVPDAPLEEVLSLLAAPLDAEQAVRIALLNDRELRARLEELGVARGRVLQAGLVANPRVEAEFLPERDTRLELSVEYEITSLVLAPLRARAARADLEAARIEVAGYVVEVAARARAAYVELAAAEQRLVVAQRALDAFAASRDTAEALHEAGNVASLDVVTERASFERARLIVANLELEVASARERLRRTLGVTGPEAELTNTTPLPPADGELEPAPELERRVIEASLDLGAARARLEASARRVGLARVSGILPEIEVDVHMLRGHPESSPGTPSGPSLRYGGGVSASVPLFDRNQGRARAAEAEVRAGAERYHGLAIELRSAAREAYNRLASAHARARHLNDVVRRAQARVLEETRLQYNAMQVDLLRVLMARRDQLDVDLAYVEALRDYWTARAEMDALLAGRRVHLDTAPARGVFTPSSSPEGGH